MRAWSVDTAKQPNRGAVWVKDGTDAPHQITANNVSAFVGGIELGGPHGDLLSYEVFARSTGNFDIRLYDVTNPHMVHLADSMNTDQNEIHPTTSGEWLLFGRGPTTPRRIVLFKLDGTGEVRTLDKVAAGSTVQAGQVNGDYAVWENCSGAHCTVHRYQISTQTDLVAPNAGRGGYAPGVTSTGVVYYVIGHATKCGIHTSLRRWAGSGSAQSLGAITEGDDVTLGTWAYERPGGGVTMFFVRVVCHGKFPTGIYSVAT